MEVHRQRCQACQSIDVRNIIVRDGSTNPRVFVRCASCKQLVAFYELSEYFHAGKDMESYLRTHRGATESGREWLAEFRRLQEHAEIAYQEALQKLEAEHKEI